jgi:hypothetical protein
LAKLTKASTWEYQASVFGAGFVGFGLGFVLKDSVGKYAWAALVLGVFLHGWGMCRINRRSNDVSISPIPRPEGGTKR